MTRRVTTPRNDGPPLLAFCGRVALLATLVALAGAAGCATPPPDPATFGGSLIYQADLGTIPVSEHRVTLLRTSDGVAERLTRAGFARFVAAVDPPERIVVRHDHGDHLERLKALIGPRGVAGFHLVSEREQQTPAVVERLRSDARRYDRALREWAAQHEGLSTRPLAQERPLPPGQVVLRRRKNNEWIVVEVDPALMVSGDRLERAVVVQDGLGAPALALSFDELGGTQLSHLTADNIGRRLAIALDDEALLVVSVYGQLHQDVFLFGIFSGGQLRDLATVLEAGALPVPLKLVSETQD